MIDWSLERGIATEANIDRFISVTGGRRLDQIFPAARFQNADYVFPDHKVIIELKILETEFGSSQSFIKKEDELLSEMAARFDAGSILRGDPAVREFYVRRKYDMYRNPLGRITKKANRQLRETKAALNDANFRGLLWLVNDNFREIGTDIALSLLCTTLVHQNSNVDGLVYVTNHYVSLPHNHLANLLWIPVYAEDAPDDLPSFVNWLGKEWGNFCEAEMGAFQGRESSADIEIRGARPIVK